MNPDIYRFIDRMEAYGTSSGLSPSVARTLGYLTISQPSRQTADDIQQALRLSAGSVSEALSVLYNVGLIERTKEPGGRKYYYEISPEGWKRATIQQLKRMGEAIALIEMGLTISPNNDRLVAMHDIFVLFDTEVEKVARKLEDTPWYNETMTNSKHTEEFTVNGEELLAKVKSLINEGNIRRIIIKDESGKVLVELPLTIGVVGAILAPMLAAVGAIAALVTKCTIVVERREN